MCLHADAVDGDGGGCQVGDERGHGGGFGAGVFDVVLVDVEFGGWVGGAGGGEDCGDVRGAEGVEEDVGAEGAVFVEGLWNRG